MAKISDPDLRLDLLMFACIHSFISLMLVNVIVGVSHSEHFIELRRSFMTQVVINLGVVFLAVSIVVVCLFRVTELVIRLLKNQTMTSLLRKWQLAEKGHFLPLHYFLTFTETLIELLSSLKVMIKAVDYFTAQANRLLLKQPLNSNLRV